MTDMWNFMNEHPTAAFFMLWIVGWVLTTPFQYAFKAYTRTLRARNIAAHGWPTAPVDADGDVVYPKDVEA